MSTTASELVWGFAQGAFLVVVWVWLLRHTNLADRSDTLPPAVAVTGSVLLFVTLRLIFG